MNLTVKPLETDKLTTPIAPLVEVAPLTEVAPLVESKPEIVTAPLVEIQPQSEPLQSEPQQSYTQPLVEIHNLNAIGALAGTISEGLTPLGNGVNVFATEWDAEARGRGTQDVFAAERELHTPQHGMQVQQPQQYQQHYPQQYQNQQAYPQQYQQQPTVLINNSPLNRQIQSIEANKVVWGLVGAMSLGVMSLVLILCFKGLQSPEERMLDAQQKTINDSNAFVQRSLQESQAVNAKVTTKAIEKGGGTFCIGVCDTKK